MDVAVLSEPLTYHRGGSNSFFRDIVAFRQGDNAATARIARHEREVAIELEYRERKAWARKPDEVEFRSELEARATPSRAPGQGGSFAPPLWLIEAFATAPRAGRVLASEMPNFELPQGVQSINVPRLTTGAHTQPVADASADPSRDVVDTATTSQVVTIAGHGDVALQLLEQSPAGAHLDWAYFKDLSESYDSQLETQLINGAGDGRNGQLAGLLSFVTGANAVTYTDSTPTATEMFSYFGQVVAAIGNNRKRPPELWMMTTSRLGWLGSSEDQQQRPLMITDRDGPGAFDLLAFPGRMNDAIPTNLAGNQDVIIACRPSDGMLFESEPRFAVHLEVLSGTLQARLQLHRYVAALNGRYPASTAALQGSGMAIAAGF